MDDQGVTFKKKQEISTTSTAKDLKLGYIVKTEVQFNTKPQNFYIIWPDGPG